MAGDAEENGSNKRRRLQGSCDSCRRKKIRCDSSEMPNNRCTNCITSGIPCTHTRTKGNDGGLSPEQLKAAQDYVATAVSSSYLPPNDLASSNQTLLEVCQYARTLEDKLAELEAKLRSQSTSKPPEGPTPDGVLVEYHNPVVAGCATNAILDPFSGYQKKDRHYGKSSTSHFVQSAIKHVRDGQIYIVGVQRADFWSAPLWEKYTIMYPPLVFPDADLLDTLVYIYFEQVNPMLGLLHRSTFERSIKARRHLFERAFGEVVLGVCAIASKYSDDPRVFLDEAPRDSEHSAGWKWFAQVRPTSASFDAAQALLQLQRLALGILYFSGSSTPDECWFHVGVGLRFLQAVGAHTSGWYKNPKLDPLDAELYKRVFWMLVFWESLMSTSKGRPRGITAFEAPLPTSLDDEFWTLPTAEAEALQQAQLTASSPAKPSIHAFLGAYVGLVVLYNSIQARVYPLDQRTPDEDDIIALDSAVNQWIDSTPEHLKWDPQQENQIFLDQSATLYSSYYHAQILIHRPFITAPGKESSSNSSFPSMAICANAARSIGHVLEVQARRGRGVVSCPGAINILFDAAVVLLINVWRLGDARGGGSDDFNRATADVRNCLKVLRLYERRWRMAGRSCDIITAMLNFSKNQSQLKRPRPQDSPSPNTSPPSLSLSESPEASLSSSASSVEEQMEALERSLAETNHLFADPGATSTMAMDFADALNSRMPIYSNELGRLPVYSTGDDGQAQGYLPFTMQQQIHQSLVASPPLYQPQSHVHAQYDEVLGMLPPELVYLAQSSMFADPEPVPQPSLIPVDHGSRNPFEVPMSPYWDEWSSYLANIGSLQEGV
ncbi:fungal-specific transcription factor domain-containing protein [Mycena amicta]|nr:fungal-specific transcription factor domain-containing protein [Mycena amicta]